MNASVSYRVQVDNCQLTRQVYREKRVQVFSQTTGYLSMIFLGYCQSNFDFRSRFTLYVFFCRLQSSFIALNLRSVHYSNLSFVSALDIFLQTVVYKYSDLLIECLLIQATLRFGYPPVHPN